MEDDDKKFQYILSRLNARESTSLGITSIASSAALVFLGISDNLTWQLGILGIFFISVGFAYNEITCHTILKDDNKYIQDKIGNKDNKNRKIRIIRLFLTRTLLLSPIIGFSIKVSEWQEYTTYFMIILGLIIVFLICVHPNSKK